MEGLRRRRAIDLEDGGYYYRVRVLSPERREDPTRYYDPEDVSPARLAERYPGARVVDVLIFPDQDPEAPEGEPIRIFRVRPAAASSAVPPPTVTPAMSSVPPWGETEEVARLRSELQAVVPEDDGLVSARILRATEAALLRARARYEQALADQQSRYESEMRRLRSQMDAERDAERARHERELADVRRQSEALARLELTSRDHEIRLLREELAAERARQGGIMERLEEMATLRRRLRDLLGDEEIEEATPGGPDIVASLAKARDVIRDTVSAIRDAAAPGGRGGGAGKEDGAGGAGDVPAAVITALEAAYRAGTPPKDVAAQARDLLGAEALAAIERWGSDWLPAIQRAAPATSALRSYAARSWLAGVKEALHGQSV